MRIIMRWLVAWVPAIFFMALLFYSSSQHSTELAPSYTVDFVVHKSIHILVYAVLYFLIFRAFYRTRRKSTHLDTVFHQAIILALLYALSDELHQQFVPTRTGRLRDVGFDAIGIFIMYSGIKYFITTLKKFL